MFKRVFTIAFVLVFALVLTLSLGGCGGKDKDDDEEFDSLDIVVGAPGDDAGSGGSGGSGDSGGSGGGGSSGGGGGPADVDEDDADDPAVGTGGGGTDGGSGGGGSGGLDLDEQYAAGEWPDNELARQVPKPGFKSSSGYAKGNHMMIFFEGLSLDDAKVYAKQLEDAGFTVDSFLDDRGDDYIYSGSNSSGYSVTFTWSTKIDPHIIVDKK